MRLVVFFWQQFFDKVIDLTLLYFDLQDLGDAPLLIYLVFDLIFWNDHVMKNLDFLRAVIRMLVCHIILMLTFLVN